MAETFTTYTRRLSREIDAAYEAYKAGKPGADIVLHAAFRALADHILRQRFRPDAPDPSLEFEIATRAVQNLHQFRAKSLLSTWFTRLARNEANRALGEFIKRREKRVPIDLFLPARASNQDDELDFAKLRESLPPEQAEVIDLLGERYSLEEIAKKLGKPIGTIRGRYRLAKAKMKREIHK
jgi:RNA polymerase sigma factor (sigma-70 family)